MRAQSALKSVVPTNTAGGAWQQFPPEFWWFKMSVLSISSKNFIFSKFILVLEIVVLKKKKEEKNCPILVLAVRLMAEKDIVLFPQQFVQLPRTQKEHLQIFLALLSGTVHRMRRSFCFCLCLFLATSPKTKQRLPRTPENLAHLRTAIPCMPKHFYRSKGF